MQLEFDLSAGALYIRLLPAGTEIARTREIDGNTSLDLTSAGDVAGIEVLDTGLPWALAQILSQYDLPQREQEQLRLYFGLQGMLVPVESPAAASPALSVEPVKALVAA